MKSFLVIPPQDQRIIQQVSGFASEKRITLYIVGGYLRDLLLKRSRQHPDIDFCLPRGALAFGKALARIMRAGYVVLDQEHGACRVVKKTNHAVYTLDFTDFRGKDLDEDLKHRDFTINTLALKVTDACKMKVDSALLYDPHGARGDLRAKILKAAHRNSFVEDPLRILRAFSFACMLGFTIHPSTVRLLKVSLKKLPTVSWERIRDELFKILDTPLAAKCLIELDALRVLKLLFPETECMRGKKQGPYHHLDIWKHSLETVKQLEGVLQEQSKNPFLKEYVNFALSSERKRRALMKLGALLHDIGKPKSMRRKAGKLTFYGHERFGWQISEGIGRRLKLSNNELEALRKMIFWHLRPGYLADHQVITPRAAFRFFRDTADEALSVLMISLADQRSTKGPKSTRQDHQQHERGVAWLFKEFFKRQKQQKSKRLVTGHDLMQRFHLNPSPLIGSMLAEIEELQAIGEIRTKQEALLAAGRLSKQKEKKHGAH
ncbi:MAG: CCA tRNA nucleotidyltransferase [Candidatus Omnitrophica bacterium]|nr:CCA tRNA nucleotidyltransferase [Candidatus Omnitrophota bacterium]